MTRSFNSMAAQLAELRERVRQQDYKEGAADHAAGILHNIRNSISPIGTIAWDLANAENATWKDQVRRALSEMQGGAASIPIAFASCRHSSACRGKVPRRRRSAQARA